MADIEMDFVGPGARLVLAAAKRIEDAGQGSVDQAQAYAGFSTRADAIAFAPKIATGVQTTVRVADTGTHAAVAGEVRLDGSAATVGELIPNAGIYAKQASGALWRVGSLSEQIAALQAAIATGAVAPFTTTLSDWIVQTPYAAEEQAYYSSLGLRAANTGWHNAIYNVPAGHQGIRASGRANAQALVIYKNAPNGPNTQASTLGYQFLNTGVAYVDQELTLPAGTQSYIINSITAVPISSSAKLVASNVGTRLSTAETNVTKNQASISAIATAISIWQSAGDALAITTGSYYTTAGGVSSGAGFNRALYVITGSETSFRFTGTLASSDSVAEIVYFSNVDGTGYISREPATPGALNGYVMTVPSTAKSIGFSSRVAVTPYLEILKPVDMSKVGATWYRGKTGALQGDSITAQDRWRAYVATALGMTLTPFGIAGTKISGAYNDADAMCGDTRINAIATTFDVISMMGGTNDWAQSIPLGDIDGWRGTASFDTNVMTVTAVIGGPAIKVGDTVNAAGVTPGTYISSFGTGTGGAGTYNLSTTPGTLGARRTRTFDPTSFYGALNTWADKARARWPLKQLRWATTPYGEIPDYVPRGWASPAHNTLGLTTNDYADAIRKCAAKRNIPILDVAQNAGWGASNIVAAMGGSVDDNLHPASGSLAAKGIGSAQVCGLRATEPVA